MSELQHVEAGWLAKSIADATRFRGWPEQERLDLLRAAMATPEEITAGNTATLADVRAYHTFRRNAFG